MPILVITMDRNPQVEAGQFRGDLYYRPNVVGINLPVLHDGDAVSLPVAGQCEGAAKRH